MANIFFTGDPHYDHDNIRIHCERPWRTIEEMNEGLADNHNSLVGPKDTTYFLGDMAFRRHAHFMGALNGKKILIIGNHDKMKQHTLRNFTAVTPLHRFLLDKQMIVLCHYKLQVWANMHYGSWHFYGHSHGRIEERPDQLSCGVGVDEWNYYPVPWEVLRAKMKARIPAWQDRRQQLAKLPRTPYNELLAPLRAENRGFMSDYPAGPYAKEEGEM